MATLDSRQIRSIWVLAKWRFMAEVQNKARVGRNEYRKVLGSEYIRELILK